jgi:hypothetical protein
MRHDRRSPLHGRGARAVASRVKAELVSLRYAEHLLRSGHSGDEIVAALSVQFGLESVDALATTAAALLIGDRLSPFHN